MKMRMKVKQLFHLFLAGRRLWYEEEEEHLAGDVTLWERKGRVGRCLQQEEQHLGQEVKKKHWSEVWHSGQEVKKVQQEEQHPEWEVV
jgi:hypothetical protein